MRPSRVCLTLSEALSDILASCYPSYRSIIRFRFQSLSKLHLAHPFCNCFYLWQVQFRLKAVLLFRLLVGRLLVLGTTTGILLAFVASRTLDGFLWPHCASQAKPSRVGPTITAKELSSVETFRGSRSWPTSRPAPTITITETDPKQKQLKH